MTAPGPARAALAVAIGLSALALAPAPAVPPHVGEPTSLEGPAALLFGHRIDPNEADRATLEVLPGVGPGKAAAWIAERRIRPFCRAADLERVKGIGPKTRRGLEPLIFFKSTNACGAIPGGPIDL